MMADFGIPCDAKSKSQLLQQLYNWLLDRYRAGETAVLVVDEAQSLSDEVLEEIRMLTNLETFTEKLAADRAGRATGTGTATEAAAVAPIAPAPDASARKRTLLILRKRSPISISVSASRVEWRADFPGRRHRRHFSLFARHSARYQPALRALSGKCFRRSEKDGLRRIVDSVARDFDLADGNAAASMIAPPPPSSEKFDLVEALRTLATLADRLRQSEQHRISPRRGNYEPHP